VSFDPTKKYAAWARSFSFYHRILQIARVIPKGYRNRVKLIENGDVYGWEYKPIKRVTLFPGEQLFKLYDTHGLPIMMSLILIKEKGMLVDWSGYFAATKRAGWSDKKALALAKEASIDSGSLLQYDAFTR